MPWAYKGIRAMVVDGFCYTFGTRVPEEIGVRINQMLLRGPKIR